MNVAALLEEQILSFKDKEAVYYKNKNITFSELGQTIDSLAIYFEGLGIRPKDKVLVFVKPGLYFPALIYALFKIEAVVVLMDPGMGIKNLKNSITQVAPDYLVAIPLVYYGAKLMRGSFSSVKKSICFTEHFVKQVRFKYPGTYALKRTEKDQLAAILFTSGGTGAPKGVLYPHRLFVAQTKLLKNLFNLSASEIDFPGFPLFALFTLAMGMSVVVPQMDASKPAQCDPRKLVNDIQKRKCSFLAGSPAIWERVGAYCLSQNIVLPSVKYLVMFGAPVSVELHQLLKKILPHGETYAPYGATECLPVSCFSGNDVLKRESQIRSGAGVCVGQVDPAVAQIKIIQITESPLAWNEVEFLDEGVVGEILVSSETTTPGYYQLEQKTKEAKIYHDQQLWHRMGDVGYLDHDQVLWFCGRKGHRVLTEDGERFSIPCESFFEEHPEVKRTALIQLKKDSKLVAGLVVERKDGSVDLSEKFHRELKAIAEQRTVTSPIEHFFLHSHFPVDGRHNIKIDRLALSRWAQERLG